MATYYANRWNTSRDVHVGLTTVISTHTWTATASVGDVILFCRIPNQATVTLAEIWGVGGADHVDYGTDSDPDRFYDSTSSVVTLHAANTALGTGRLYRYSASSDDELSYEYVRANVLVADSSLTESISVIVQYFTDN